MKFHFFNFEIVNKNGNFIKIPKLKKWKFHENFNIEKMEIFLKISKLKKWKFS